MAYILAFDAGTTSARSILFDQNGKICGIAQRELGRNFPNSAWVEQDPEELFNVQLATAREVLAKSKVDAGEVAAIGITNQRETTVVWDRTTGQAVYPAIVWQDRRTAAYCDSLKEANLEKEVRSRTGLVIDPYFSGTKIRWILRHLRAEKPRFDQSKLAFGTVDSWLIWNLTGGKVHATDYSNASRTLLYNIKELRWDEYLLAELEVPASMLPKVKPSSGDFGKTDPRWFGGVEIPIAGVAGDQQAALFGQACFEPGMAKNTYGTGCFVLMNTGEKCVQSDHGLITTLAWGIGDRVTYALEGSIFVAGAAIQWLRDGLRIIDDAADTESWARKVANTDGVYVVPAFAGLGTPYWDPYARGAILGLTLGSTKAHIIRATLESLAYQSRDVVDMMTEEAGSALRRLRVDGGAARNNFLMQFQADILGVPVERPEITETTALGAAYLAGLAVSQWDYDTLAERWSSERIFSPEMTEENRAALYSGWKKAVERARNWAED